MVKTKSTIKKELRSTIKLNIKRYISLIIMIFLGVAFFVGMRINSSVLQNSMIKYFEKYNYADMKVASEIGLSDEELYTLQQKVPDVELAEGKYYKELVVSLKSKGSKKKDKVFAVHSYSKNDKLNKVDIIEGKSIKKTDECLVDKDLKKQGYHLGDTIELKDDMLLKKTYKIVGFVNDTQYISIDKGTSDLLSGKIDYFVYVDKLNFQVEDNLYIIFDIKLKNKYKTFSDEYNNYLEKTKNKVIKASKSISKERKQQIIDKKTKELDDAEKAYNTKKEEVDKELEIQGSKIAAAEKEINYAESKIMTEREIDIYLGALKTNLDSSKAQLDSLKSSIDVAKQTLKDFSSYGANEAETLKEKLVSLEEKISVANDTITRLRAFLEDYESTCQKAILPSIIATCNSALSEIRTKIQEQEANINTLQAVMDNINKMIKYIEEKQPEVVPNIEETAEYKKYSNYIKEMENKYNTGIAKYNTALQEYNYAVANLKPQSAAAKATLNNKKTELANAKKEYEAKKKEAYDKLEKVYNTIKDNRKLLQGIGNLEWHVFTRNDSFGYSNYYNDTQKINNLAKLFPMLFFIVASLVTATSITRLIQEERSKIGILKSLGYSKKQIMKKYLNYSFTAAIIGSILGVLTGTFIFPIIFVKVYSLLYLIPKIQYGLYIKEILLAVGLSFISTILVAYLAAKNISDEKPSDLMRPKVMKNSRKTLLEKQKSLWKKMTYIKRIAYRNIFLSIGRSLMTIIGIAGCTTLIISSFGVRDSIQNVLSMQFNRVFDMSVQFFYKQDLTQYDIEAEYKRVSKLDSIEHASLNRLEMQQIKVGKKSDTVRTIIPNDANALDNEIKLYNVKNNKKVNLAKTTGVVITEKLAKVKNVKVGDKIQFTDSSNITHSVKVSAIVENYISHYIYMNQNTYKKVYGYESANNMIITKYKEDKLEKDVTSEIFSSKKYSSFLSMIYYKNMTANVLKTFDIILYLIIIAAGLLAFVVLYNLAKINISERITEVATLKVLGYDSKRINKYINYEINILTNLGIIIGLIGGYFLTDIIITTCELDFIMFYHGISYISYILGVILTIVFSRTINVLVSRDLKKISITESLKSID